MKTVVREVLDRLDALEERYVDSRKDMINCIMQSRRGMKGWGS